jgi:uncharacterized membrane protein
VNNVPPPDTTYVQPSFDGPLATDVAYQQTAEIQWSNFSAWLIATGMVFGVLSLLLQLFSLFSLEPTAHIARNWVQTGLVFVALVVALANNFIHARDGWISVVPVGLTLSIITVLLLIAAYAMRASSARYNNVGG